VIIREVPCVGRSQRRQLTPFMYKGRLWEGKVVQGKVDTFMYVHGVIIYYVMVTLSVAMHN
jgi:hypothetical protein